MKQIYLVGGQYEHPSDFAKAVNRNLKILKNSDNNAKVLNVDFNVHNDSRYSQHGPTYLAFILTEVDVDTSPKVQDDGITRKKKKKKKK